MRWIFVAWKKPSAWKPRAHAFRVLDLKSLTSISSELVHYTAVHKLHYERLRSRAVGIPRAQVSMVWECAGSAFIGAKIASQMLSSTPLRLYAGSIAIVLAYLVLSHGGLEQPNWYIGLLVLALISIVYWTRTSAEQLAPPLDPWIAWPAVLFPLYVACQLLPLPVDVLRVLAPSRAQLIENLARVGEHLSFAPISIKPEVTSAYLLRIVAYAVFFLLIRELAWHARKRQSFALVMPLVAIAAIEAVSGLVQNALGADTVGAYGNKNHLAGLFEMILPVTLAVGFALIAHARSRSDSRGARTLAGSAVLLLAALFLAGLVATVSKMGYVAALCGLAVMGAVALATIVHGWQRWLSAAVLTGIFAFGLVFLPSDELMRAFSTLFSGEWSTGEGRWPIFLNALNLIRAFPLAGCGLGNFETGFLRFQAAVIDRDFSYAHNDYLQLASELGLAGFAIVAALALAIFWKAFCAAIQEHDQIARSLGLGCVGALAAIGVHSLADFNIYIPANAVVLAWIFGIAASLPDRGSTVVRERKSAGSIFSRGVPVFLTGILILFAPAWIVFETHYHSNSQAERLFCRFGICDSDAVLEAEAAGHGGNVAALPVEEILWALGRDAASPTRWCDLGEAFAKRREITAARLCFSTAVALGPYVPLVLRRASQFALDSQQQELALQENGRVLEKTSAYDDSIFQWYRASKIPVADVLANGLALDRRASQAYLRYWMDLGNGDVAAQAWDWILAHSFADAPLARDYVNFVFNSGQYKSAAEDWARYLGDHRNGYLESDWLYNGDFESEPDGLALDWRLEGVTDQVEVARDATVAHSGAYSLRVQFLGKENVNFSQTFQSAYVRPGSYRFQAFIRTEGITTDQGIGFQISSDDPPLNVKTEQRTGTHDWQKIEQTLTVPAGAQLLIVRIIRQPSLKFDSLIAGTAWIDSVRLLPIEDRNARDESSALNLPAKRTASRR